MRACHTIALLSLSLTITAFGAATTSSATRRAPAPPQTPATAPATFAATRDNSPRGVLVASLEGQYAGDLKAMLDTIWCSDAKHRETHAATWGFQCAEQHLRQAITTNWGDEPERSAFEKVNELLKGHDRASVGMTATQFEDQKRTFATGDLKVDGDTATLTLTILPGRTPPEVCYLIKKDGTWKIDMDKTGPKERNLTAAELAKYKKFQSDIESLAADVKANKVADRQAAWDRYFALYDAAFPPPPATKP
jgi:hypothetical protein